MNRSKFLTLNIKEYKAHIILNENQQQTFSSIFYTVNRWYEKNFNHVWLLHYHNHYDDINNKEEIFQIQKK